MKSRRLIDAPDAGLFKQLEEAKHAAVRSRTNRTARYQPTRMISNPASDLRTLQRRILAGLELSARCQSPIVAGRDNIWRFAMAPLSLAMCDYLIACTADRGRP